MPLLAKTKLAAKLNCMTEEIPKYNSGNRIQLKQPSDREQPRDGEQDGAERLFNKVECRPAIAMYADDFEHLMDYADMMSLLLYRNHFVKFKNWVRLKQKLGVVGLRNK